MLVKDIHQTSANRGGWLLVIEGCPVAFTNIEALVGSGAGSWIGTSYGARNVLPGLVVPDLPLGQTEPIRGLITESRPTFTLLDYGGEVADLFAEVALELTVDSMAARLSPKQDPAPEVTPGPAATPVNLWDRHVGTEAIGPAGERRHYWVEPVGKPPGLDHIAGIGWPPSLVTDRPVVWTGRLAVLYRIVQDPDTGAYPNWHAQHAGGSLWWTGKIKGRGTFISTSEGRALQLPVSGVGALLRRPLNLSRPTPWLRPQGGVNLTGDRAVISVWIAELPRVQVGDGISFTPSVYPCMTVAAGYTLAGLTTREQIAARIRAVVEVVTQGADFGGVLAADLETWTGPDLVANSVWGLGGDGLRKVEIGATGSTVRIKCEPVPQGTTYGYEIVIAVDVTVWQLLGWDTNGPEFTSANGWLPMGGLGWGAEPAGASNVAPSIYIGSFGTRRDIEDPVWEWAFGGDWRHYIAPYPNGTVTLAPEGGDLLRLAIGEVRCEGQLAQPYEAGATIDAATVDSVGWWAFRGERLTAQAFLAGDDPVEDLQIALCQWVATASGDGVEVDDVGWARLSVIRWEDPRRFGVDHDRFGEPWVSVIGGLECSPIGVLGGISPSAPGWRHRMIPRLLLASGTATQTTIDGVVTLTPGANHPVDLPPGDPWAGDLEVADLGLGLPRAWVDWRSWYTCAAKLPAGAGGAINRVTYALSGSTQAEGVLEQAMRGAGWAWSWKRTAGTGVPALGCWDPAQPLSLDDVEVTLRRGLQAETASAASSTKPQWRAVLELRSEGPYDVFDVGVDRGPYGDALAYSRRYEAEDPGRRYRDGKIVWEVSDGGLRDPTPWISTPAAAIYDWTGQARDRFAGSFARRYARAVRVYRAIYDGTLVTRLGLGTIVRVIDATVESPTGERGVDHIGRVVEATILKRGGIMVAVELQSFGVEAIKVWAPSAVCASAGSWDAAELELSISADWAGVGGGHSDHVGFARPADSELGAGPLRIVIYQSEDGRTYPDGLEVRADVVTAAPGVLTLGELSGTLYRDTIKRVHAAPYDAQTAPWALTLYLPITEPTGLYDGDKAWRL